MHLVVALLSTEGSLVNQRDLLALYLSGNYCHKIGTRPPSCVIPPQPTLYLVCIGFLYNLKLDSKYFDRTIFPREIFQMLIGNSQNLSFFLNIDKL